MMRSRLLLAGVAALFVSGALGLDAHAVERGDIGTIGPKKTHLEFNSPPMAGVYADPAVGAFAEIRPPICRAATYCDAVQFEVDYPNSYLRSVFFGLTITLSWENPYHSSKNPTGNDLDLFLWSDDGPAAGGPTSKCGAPYDEKCENIHPEILTMTEPPNTLAEDAEPPAVFLTVVNHRGVNTGYKLTVDWFTFELDDPPKFKAPDRETSVTTPSTEVTGPFDFEVTEDDSTAPEATPRVILVPGPDGKLHEVELPIYAAGQRLGTTAARSSAAPWITAAVIGAICFGLLVWYLIRRNRQAMEQL